MDKVGVKFMRYIFTGKDGIQFETDEAIEHFLGVFKNGPISTQRFILSVVMEVRSDCDYYSDRLQDHPVRWIRLEREEELQLLSADVSNGQFYVTSPKRLADVVFRKTADLQ